MSDVLTAGLLGALAGLGVAMPLGAVGVLLLRTAMAAGWRPAAAGALGVATVDLGYAVVAVLAGTAVTAALDGHERTVRIVGAVVLAAIAVRGLARVAMGARRPDAPGPAVRVGARAAYGQFVGITLVNPLTAGYFAVVAAGLAHRLAGPGPRLAFVLGVAAASVAWQLALAWLGTAVGLRAGPRRRTALTVAGDVLVLALATAVALA